MNKYYRQNLHNHPSEEERAHQLAIEAAKGSDDSSSEEETDQRVARRNERERGRALASRANGGRGMLGVTAEKRKEVLAEEKRSWKAAERARRQYEWGNNRQANSQKHFRVSLLPCAHSFFVLTDNLVGSVTSVIRSCLGGLFIASNVAEAGANFFLPWIARVWDSLIRAE